MDRLLPGLSGNAAQDQARFAASRDRILLTLLALNLMLMAFFVVLNSTAKIDHRKANTATQSLQAAVAEQRPHSDQIPRSQAVEDLRTRIAAVFATYLADANDVHADDARVDVTLPSVASLPEPVLSGIARLVTVPPAGYRIELLVQGVRVEDDVLATIANDLVGHGVNVEALAIGTHGGDAPGLRFTFMLLDPDAESAAAQTAVRGEP
jgi:septum formation topological specificity factor MinE